MTRLFATTASLIFVAAAAFAASGSSFENELTVIEIEVPATKLAECRETLSQVAQMPTVSDDGTPLLFGVDDDLPSVICVVSEQSA
ncbi:hypothetical protein P775_18945 [Puniceibacterium antarcticum]|uniref:Uncharacterized protein n=2 Tax=Puniceibacterium antarcticum TaxID=1206336 RepID=A0A2G8RAR6_9RHOB|nr:hypothetical protein P775_18945 [Puniceibacterium antarcticum]